MFFCHELVTPLVAREVSRSSSRTKRCEAKLQHFDNKFLGEDLRHVNSATITLMHRLGTAGERSNSRCCGCENGNRHRSQHLLI